MSKSYRRPLALALALAVPALAVAVPALANVRHSVPGMTCALNSYLAAQGGVLDVYPNGSAALHTTSTDANFAFGVECPLIRGLPLSTDGLSDLEIRFKSVGTQPSQPACFAVSVRTDGTLLTTEYKSMNLAAGASGTLDFNDMVDVSMSKGTYALECLLPNTVQLVSVYHSEVDGISGN